MNLVLITALVAVAGAAKLDRAYLPPASAKTAGGSPGSLQTPFAGNSFNNGLGGLPKGSYNNEFQGVVVDAAAAGTRAAESGETGLGAPRIAYGSTDSRVGAAAFKANPAGFPQSANFQTRFGGSAPDGQASGTELSQGFQAQGSSQPQGSQGFSNQERARAALDRAANTIKFESSVGPESFNYAFETDNGISAEESGVATNGVQAQGAFSYTGDDGQVYSVTYTADERGYLPQGDHLPTPPPIPEEILKSLEQNAREEAAGLVDDGSYDAQKYNAGSDYSETDDQNGKYNHQSSKFGNRNEADATASGTFISQSNQPFARPGQSGSNSLSGSNAVSNRFGSGFDQFGQSGSTGQSSNELNRLTTTTTAGQFGTDLSGQAGHSETGSSNGQQGSSSSFGKSGQGDSTTTTSGSFGQSSNRLVGSNGPTGSSGFHSTSSRFSEHSAQGSLDSTHSQVTDGDSSFNAANKLSQKGQENLFGNLNGYLPPQHGPNLNRLQTARPQGFLGSDNENVQQFNQKSNINDQNENVQPLSQQKLQDDTRLQGSISSSFRRPSSDGISGQSRFGSNTGAFAQNKPFSNAFRPSLNSDNSFPQASSSSNQDLGNRFGSKNEYLPPLNSFNQNQRPNQGFSQGSTAPTFPPSSQFTQQFSGNTRGFDSFQGTQESGSATTAASDSQPTFGAQRTQTFNSFQRPQSQTNGKLNFQGSNRFSSSQETGQTTGQTQTPSGFSSFASQHATSQPDTELTTPFESSGPQHSAADTSSSSTISSFTSSISQPSNKFGNKLNNEANVSPTPTMPSVFPSFNTQSTFGSKRPSVQSQSPQTSFSQTEDAQFSPSTSRPNYSQQAQGPDDSYYYNQPSRHFGTPEGSRFPNTPTNKFNRVTQGPSSQSNQFSKSPQPTSPTAFSTQNGQFQSQTKYPRPPSIAPVAPTSSSQQSNSFNGVTGITQASISPFPSESPTQSSQFSQQGQFGARLNYQQSSNQFNQGQSLSGKPSFGQQSTSPEPSFAQQTTAIPSFPQRFGSKPYSQSPSQTFGQQTLTQDQPEPTDDTSESTVSQQYDGEIYEYKKPPQSLPAPDHQDSTSGTREFGQKDQTQFSAKPSRPQLGQTNDDDSQGSTTFQFGQTVQSSKPQFDAQPSRSQIGLNAQIQNKFGGQVSNFKQQSAIRSQFGSQPTRPFSSAQLNSQFEQGTDSQEPQPTQGSGTQFGPQNAGRPFSSCCQFGVKAGQQNQDFGLQTQNRFSAQSQSFSGTQDFKADPTTSSFAGKGEVFGGPRKPPSFDPETGYHY